MKRFLSVILAGAMICAMVLPAAASSSPSRDDNSGSTSPRVEASTPTQDDSGFPPNVVAEAAAVGKTPAEYVNNAIISTPGLEGELTIPIAQGGHITVNGAVSRRAFIPNKVTRSVAQSASAYARARGGRLLNVCRTSSINMPAFSQAIVPFYMRGLSAESKVEVLRLTANGWEPVIAAARLDHVDVLMNQHETLMFVLLP